jgi:hypothetical protein
VTSRRLCSKTTRIWEFGAAVLVLVIRDDPNRKAPAVASALVIRNVPSSDQRPWVWRVVATRTVRRAVSGAACGEGMCHQ